MIFSLFGDDSLKVPTKAPRRRWR